MFRDDLSNRLIHLSKGSYEEAKSTFYKIMKDGKLIGSNEAARGDDKVICFSEAPISKLSTILANPNAHNMRYRPFGVMYEKSYLFEKGARPVIYQTNTEYDLLNSEQKYRHVRFEPSKGIDWTWEREWRIRADELDLDEEKVTLIVPNRSIEEEMKSDHHARISRASMLTSFGPNIVGKFSWHFIVLEDLGVDIPSE